jgi:malonate-semialdehyde dehydrogenase (acetylating)/methylmalonate-semialdehyde dehydrogenase
MKTHPYLSFASGEVEVSHFLNGHRVPGSPEEAVLSVKSPYTGQPLARVPMGSAQRVDEAVRGATRAQPAWGETPLKERTRVLVRFREELQKDWARIVATKSFECAKTLGEAEAGLAKGVEVLEYALALQNLDLGGRMEVSRGVHCELRRVPLGVVAGITPFNFPAMVPMWMFPIALALGNAFVWKPSEKVALTSQLLAECWKRAGLPDGLFQVVQGNKDTVSALLEHPGIRAVGFVGSTPIARAVYAQGTAAGKRVLALGGAKNHLILLPDADPELAPTAIRDSFTGCAGQRCMAGSVLLAVGAETQPLIDRLVALVKTLQPGRDLGAIITKEQREFLVQAIDRAEKEGAQILVDGRKAPPPAEFAGGNWIGPTLLDRVAPGSEAATRELFGPILSIVRCKDLSEALRIDAESPYGNATSVFTRSGALAEEVARLSASGMIGVNVGVPVPREPFSFGGTFDSKFGSGDITGHASLNFWTDLKKITVKWAPQKDANWMS